MPVRKSEGEDLSGTASKNKKRPWSIQGRFLFYNIGPFLFVVDASDVFLQRHGHGRCFRRRCLNVYPKSCIGRCFDRTVAKNRYSGIVLFKIGEVLHKGLNTGRTEEDQDVIIYIP